MRNRLVGIVLVVSAVAALAAHVWPVRAQETRGVRWEYCYVRVGENFVEGLKVAGVASTIVYFTPQGARTERVESTHRFGESASSADPYLRAIARLGREGWEAWARDDAGTTYLKRRIE